MIVDFEGDYGSSLNEEVLGVKVYGLGENWFEKIKTSRAYIAVGDNLTRKKLIEQCHNYSIELPIFLAESVTFDESAILGEGTIVLERAFIGPYSRIGIGGLINTAAIIEHEVKIGDYSQVSPQAVCLGRVQVGNQCLIGSGSIIRDGVVICDEVTVGASSYVNTEIEERGIYIGSPAKKYS